MIESFAASDWRSALPAFRRDGIAILSGLLDAQTVARIRAVTDAAIDGGDPNVHVQNVYTAPVLRNTQSIDPLFGDLLVRPPQPELNRELLGEGYGFCGQNVIRTDRDQGVSRWHVDGVVEFPCAPGQERHDPRSLMPVQWYSMQIALTDILSPDDGPTEVVVGSHYAGRNPPGDRQAPDEANPPTFEGRGPTQVLCRAGDAYLFNHQLWHRGALNRSGRRRYLMQNQYCQAWLIRRFDRGPHRQCTLPPEVAATLDAESRRLLLLDE